MHKSTYRYGRYSGNMLQMEFGIIAITFTPISNQCELVNREKTTHVLILSEEGCTLLEGGGVLESCTKNTMLGAFRHNIF